MRYKIIIKNILGDTLIESKHDKKPNYKIEFLNTKPNHVEKDRMIHDNAKIEEIT